MNKYLQIHTLKSEKNSDRKWIFSLEMIIFIVFYLNNEVIGLIGRLFGWVLWHINLCRLFNAKSSLYIYIKYIWFTLVGFYGISTIVGYLMPNPLYTYMLNI